MSDFTMLFDRIGNTDLQRLTKALQDSYGRRLCQGVSATRAWHGPANVVLHTFGTEHDDLQVHTSDEGFAIVKGLAFDASTRAPASPVKLLSTQSRGQDVVTGLEGAFAAIAYSHHDGRFVGFNDPFSTQNLYIGDFHGVVALTTLALPVAKALSLTLDHRSVQMFLTGGWIPAPASMFEGLARLSIGEFASGRPKQRLAIARAWQPDLTIAHEKRADSAQRIGDALVTVIEDVARSSSPILADLTGGYDSRLIVAALSRSGADLALTVNGSDADPDVLAATGAAAHCGWPITHFDPSTFWTVPIDQPLRRELVCRTGGELSFTAIYHQYLSRPQLAQKFGVHLNGGGGELLRSVAWYHDLEGLIRKRPANAHRLARYRWLRATPFPPELLVEPFYDDVEARLTEQVEGSFALCEGGSTVQQLDAAFIWGLTGHVSLWTSATSEWLTTAAPLLTTGPINVVLSIPWWNKRTSQLQRLAIERLDPELAQPRTAYGSTANPTTWRTAHRETGNASKIIRRLVRTWVGSAVDRRLGRSKPSSHGPQPPFLTPEFREFTNPKRMLSRRLYDAAPLEAMMTMDDDAILAMDGLLPRIATVETLCRELEFEPDASWLLGR
jgi:hypothetical protein